MSQSKPPRRAALETTHFASSSSEPASTRTARRPLLLLAVVGLLLGWGGCGSEKKPTGPAGDAVEEAIQQVAASPWRATLETSRTLQSADEGWELADRRDRIHGGFAPYNADGPVVIASDYGRVTIQPHDRGAIQGVVSANAVVYPAAADGADVVIALRRSGVEELLILHDDSAPHTLRYRLEFAREMTVAASGDGLAIFDAKGRHFMRMAPPAAADAAGAPVPVTIEWRHEQDTVELELTVADGGPYPKVVDPEWLFGAGFPEETIVGHEISSAKGVRCSATFLWSTETSRSMVEPTDHQRGGFTATSEPMTSSLGAALLGHDYAAIRWRSFRRWNRQ